MPNATDNPLIFYFAWADSSETTFGIEHLLLEDNPDSLPIFRFSLEHAEGSAAILTVMVRNPKVAILGQDKLYCWFSCSENGNVTPLFFGRLVGIPTDLLAEVCTFKFSSEPVDFEEKKQRLAETLKVRPWWDPVFLAPDKRDDPNSVLEGYSARWHVGRTDQTVTISDIINGEDGDEAFTGDEVPYDSVRLDIGEVPPQKVLISADVTWTQKATGIVGMGTQHFSTYTGATLISEWPKALQSLGSGWFVKAASAIDVNKTDEAVMYNFHDSWTNHEKTHEVGDAMQVDISESRPLQSDVIKELIFHREVIGLISPDPDEQDRQPATSNATFMYICRYIIDTSLTLRYQVKRQRGEHLSIPMHADLQPLLAPTLFPTEEIMSVPGIDVGQPLVDIKNWLAIKDTDVVQSQVMYTNYPDGTLPNSFQIAKGPGHTGAGAEPEFSTEAGVETVDGTVTWISLGPTFNLTPFNWQLGTFIRTGQLLLPEVDDWAFWNDLVPPPRINGVSVFDGTYLQASDGSSFHICTQAGTTGTTEPSWATTYGAETTDGDVTWTCLGTKMPSGDTYFIALNPGQTGLLYFPAFTYVIGDLITDGTVVWKCLGAASDFAPPPIGDVARRSYFPTDRGLWSLEYLVSLARARLRQKARAVKLSFECKFARAMSLSCRKTATLTDDRLPSGTATGKIIAYSLEGNGDTGEYVGKVTVGCAIGRSTTGLAVTVAGEPDYIEADTFEDAPVIAGTDATLVGADVGYSVPIDSPADDGLVFPLTKQQVTIKEETHIGNQAEAITLGIQTAKDLFVLNLLLGSGQLDPDTFLQKHRESVELGKHSLETLLSKPKYAIWYDLWLRPVQAGPYNQSYIITTTPLQVIKQIDVEGASA